MKYNMKKANKTASRTAARELRAPSVAELDREEKSHRKFIEDTLEAMDKVASYEHRGVFTRQAEALGFLDGKLVFFDGFEIKPVGLRESAEWYAKMEDHTSRFELESCANPEAASRWLAMIAAVLPESPGNLTLNLPDDLLHRLKVTAEHRGETVNEIVIGWLMGGGVDDQYNEAVKAQRDGATKGKA